MRISHSTKLRADKARALYQQYGNMSRVARELNIHRSTLDRWRSEGLLDPQEPSTEQEFSLDYDQMVSKDLKVIDQALEGEKITPNQIRAAIEVTKLSNSLRSQARAEESKQSLAELIAHESNNSSD